jgi:hypothetical protein
VAKSNLTTRLTKELRRSPKKTAVLALMVVVALWFWAPLAWKWIAPQSSDAATTAAPPTPSDAATTGGIAASSTPSAPAQPALNWRELASVLESDPLLASARMHEKLADPFVNAVPVEESKATDEGAAEPTADIAQASLTPEQLGLTLTSTITGGRRAVATINGKSCRVGDVIVVPGGGTDFEFTVAAIAAREVTLVAGGQTYTLTVRQPDSTMQLSQAGSTTTPSPESGQRVVIGARLGE